MTLKDSGGMEILNRFVAPFMLPLVPHIPIGIGMGFIGKIPFKIKITPPDPIAFLLVNGMRIPEDFMDRTVGNKGADPEICITGNIVANRQVSVKRNGLFNDDVVNHIDPRRGICGERVEVAESMNIG
jgi:hypothetical protein